MSFNAYTDKESPDFWRALGNGDMITLSDLETLTHSESKGLGLNPIEYQIDQVIAFAEYNGLAEWRAIHLDDPEMSFWIWVKIVDQIVEIKTGWENSPDAFLSGDRQDMVDRDYAWLFSEESVERYMQTGSVNDLMYVEELSVIRDMPDGSKSEFIFTKKANLEFQCECHEFPAPSGLSSRLMGTVAEYICDDANCPYPELVIFEIGALECDDYYDDDDDEEDVNQTERGGFIRILNANTISFTNFDALKIER